MAKKRESDKDPSALRTVSEDGVAPGHRIKSANQAFEIADDLDRQDSKRRRKRGRIFKSYNRFPPTEYSTLFKDRPKDSSNVNFGMMAFIVDNNLSSFYDMVTERVVSADIKTKHGKPAEQLEWSEHISIAFDKVVREWDEYLFNVEQNLLDMLLYSKGIEMTEDTEGCMSEHISADDVLVAEDTKVSLCNWTEIVVKRSYTLLELYKKIKDSDTASHMGWNKEAVIKAMRLQRDSWSKKDDANFYKDIASGNITVGGHMKERVDTYIVFIREFNDKVSKYVVLQDYAPFLSLTRGKKFMKPEVEEEWEKKEIDNQGFLYSKTDYADTIQDVFSVFMDCAGSGEWHRVPSLGEKIFVHCRQYDVVMNSIMDGIKMNMSLMLQASSPDASQKIKEIVFGPLTIIPSEVPFVQQRLALPVVEATQGVAFMMQDMRSGLGEYRVSERAKGGEAMTATQRQLDAAEAAKLTGTQLKRFNGQFTFYFRKLYERLVKLVDGEKDYEHCKKFKDYLSEMGVPDEAWEFDNIEKIESNMLTGAGSPSYKLMAAKETLAITNITPNGEGQRKAMEDALAALHGRSNVSRYMPQGKPDLTWNERIGHWENCLLADMSANPADVQVRPSDNHLYHVSVHLDTMDKTVLILDQKIKAGKITEAFAEQASFKLLNIGGHAMAHLKQIQKDELKEEQAKQYAARLNVIQRAADKISQNMTEMKNKKTAEFDPSKDPDIQKAIALSQIEIDTKQKLSNISIGAKAASHAQRMEIDDDKAANQIAINRAVEQDKIRTRKKAEAKAEAKKTTPKGK